MDTILPLHMQLLSQPLEVSYYLRSLYSIYSWGHLREPHLVKNDTVSEGHTATLNVHSINMSAVVYWESVPDTFLLL